MKTISYTYYYFFFFDRYLVLTDKRKPTLKLNSNISKYNISYKLNVFIWLKIIHFIYLIAFTCNISFKNIEMKRMKSMKVKNNNMNCILIILFLNNSYFLNNIFALPNHFIFYKKSQHKKNKNKHFVLISSNGFKLFVNMLINRT